MRGSETRSSTSARVRTGTADEGFTVGHRPGRVAASCLSLAAERCGLYLSQRQITDVADVSSTTLHS
ncbi:hypothetical protein [Halomontanus rarus]|uniref:hypothetical protein n=1 Tax=Halomontanus rarus TaxID=3034020 RepID=UPI003CE452FF